MITKEEFVMIHTLKSQGYSIRAIARMTGLNRRTISKRLKGKSLKGYKKRDYISKLDAYKNYIIKRITDALPDKIPSSVLYEEIVDMGYKGKIRILQYFIKEIYENLNPKKEEEIIRFETKAGYQAQCDWTILRSGKKPLYGFVMLLGYSRYAFVYITDNMRQETFQECHKKAFEYFGGIPKTILYDNLKSVVIKRDKYGKNQHGFNDKFLDFSKSYKFIPKLCKPYRPVTKGKVERFNLYLKNNFYKPLKSKLKGSGIEIDNVILNNYLSPWLIKANNRVHSTTNQKPSVLLNQEKESLISLSNIITIKIEKNKEKMNKKDIKNKNVINTINCDISLNHNEIPNIDINYHTTLSDYETILLDNNKNNTNKGDYYA